MTTADVLSRLAGVRPRSHGRWTAQCPAHPDKSPSLSVSEGERGVLVKCWAGCSIDEICSALGLNVHDLFFDDGFPQTKRRALRLRVNLDDIAFQFRLHAALLAIRAEQTLAAARNLNCSSWTDLDFDYALEAIGQAYADMDHAEIFEQVAFGLRCRVLDREKVGVRAA